MKIIRTKLFFYLTFIISFLAFVFLYIGEYKKLYSTSNQTADEKIVLKQIYHLDKLQIFWNDIESNTRPLLIFRYKNISNNFDKACYMATRQIDSLKQLCGNAYIPCNEIFRLDSLFREHLIFAHTLVDLSQHGEVNHAIQLLNSRTNESKKSVLINTYQNISKQGRDKMEVFHKNDDIRSRYMYGVLGLVMVITFLLLGYILLRLLKQITRKDRLLLQYKIFENAADGHIVTDANFNINYFNNAINELFDLKDRQINGKHITELFADTKNESDNPLLVDGFKKMEINSYDYLLQKTGRWLRINIFPSSRDFSINIKDISALKEAEDELLYLNNELREFSKHLQYVRETEKNKIAKEVHDELGQGLAALKFDVSWIKKHLNDDKIIIEQKIDDVLDSISEKLAAFRKIYIAANTTMLQEIGLNASVEYLIDRFTKTSFIPIKFTSNIESEQISSEKSLALYRILEESLSNIMRYAGATEVLISLFKKDNLLNLLIQDNGRGFDITKIDTKSNHGILEMRERVYAMNGKFTINAAIGEGTRISIEVVL